MTKARDIADSELGSLTVDTDTLVVDSANNRVGIGTSSPAPDATLQVDGTDTVLLVTEDSEGEATLRFGDTQGDLSQSFAISYDTGGGQTFFRVNDTTVGRWNTGDDFMVGGDAATGPFALFTGNNDETKVGVGLRSVGYVAASRYQAEAMFLNRMNNDGNIVQFRKDGNTVGSIGSAASANNLYVDCDDGNKGGIQLRSTDIIPRRNGAPFDNGNDIGDASFRWDDIFATNGTIQTSDRNEKQDIEDLTEAEQRAAVACKGLLRKFRWKSAVEEKGDDARIHFGIIAQDLQDAFAAEGLDAGRYGMFISSTWWEAEETYTDDDGVEQTRTNTYDTQEDAPEGAIERTRMGVRYPELLAFIIAAI